MLQNPQNQCANPSCESDASDTALRCLVENQHFYALHKPPKVPFHSLDELDSLSDQNQHVSGIVNQAKTFLNDEAIYPVHRLDRMTSGLMLFARSKQVNRYLSQSFADKKIEKYYLALSSAKPKKKQGAIIGDMAKSRSGSYILKRTTDMPAITRFFAKRILFEAEPYWLSILKPETGKTHQLRVALKSLGAPILGDRRYSGQQAARGYLHAYKVRFNLFDTFYEIEDPYFYGPEFNLKTYIASLDETNNDQIGVSDFFSPECLSWPSSSFKAKSGE